MITAIAPRRKSLKALYLDGEYAVDIDKEVLLLSGFREGMQINDEQFHDLIIASNERRAREKALYLLSHRDHTQKELIEKIRKTTDEQAAEKAAERMKELGLIDDEAFARRYAKELLFRKKFSRSRTEYELTKKGIDRDLIAELLEEFEPDPKEQILELVWQKYLHMIKDEKGKKRTVMALQRLGYRWEDIRSALKEIADRQDCEEEN